jgi:hypothetical protein
MSQRPITAAAIQQHVDDLRVTLAEQPRMEPLAKCTSATMKKSSADPTGTLTEQMVWIIDNAPGTAAQLLGHVPAARDRLRKRAVADNVLGRTLTALLKANAANVDDGTQPGTPGLSDDPDLKPSFANLGAARTRHSMRDQRTGRLQPRDRVNTLHGPRDDMSAGRFGILDTQMTGAGGGR